MWQISSNLPRIQSLHHSLCRFRVQFSSDGKDFQPQSGFCSASLAHGISSLMLDSIPNAFFQHCTSKLPPLQAHVAAQSATSTITTALRLLSHPVLQISPISRGTLRTGQRHETNAECSFGFENICTWHLIRNALIVRAFSGSATFVEL